MRSGRSAAAVLAAAAVLVAGCTGEQRDPTGSSPATTITTTEPTAPAEVEDPYFPDYGNSGYQVEHYDLAVTYDPGGDELTGEVAVHATAARDLATLSLDLSDSLVVGDVAVDGAAAGADHEDDKLQVTPATELAAGAGFTVAVTYQGVPEPVGNPSLGSDGFHHTDGGAFAIGEPHSASTWFPVNEHPSDKATYAIELTVPEGLAAVSNGVPAGTTTADGWATWEWSEEAPMASYLATLAVGDYRVHETTHDDGLPVVVAVHSDLPTAVDEQLARTPEIADLLAGWFGPYPFAAYGGIVLSDQRIRYALETQSRPVYGPTFFREQDGSVRDASWVIVHELAHQWFGNSVSLSRWQDIWLNEGFATYAEWLWAQEDGRATVAETFDQYWDRYRAEDAFWEVPPGDPGPRQLFDQAVYVRGAMALHALRRTVGDDAFFRILREWADGNRYGNVETDDFITLSERVSGEVLTPLFEEWLYTPGRPAHPG